MCESGDGAFPRPYPPHSTTRVLPSPYTHTPPRTTNTRTGRTSVPFQPVRSCPQFFSIVASVSPKDEVTYPYGLRTFFVTSSCAFAFNHLGITFPIATPNASNTIQYPRPVDANEPTLCPTTHKLDPKRKLQRPTPIAGATLGWTVGAISTGDGDGETLLRSVNAGWSASGRGSVFAHGDTGEGVGCVCSSSLAPLAPGSRKEKKLWDNECLWWWPLLELMDDVEDDDKEGAIKDGDGMLPFPLVNEGGRLPNVKPTPIGEGGCRGDDEARCFDLQLTLAPAAGTSVTGASPSPCSPFNPSSSSCAPSSAIGGWGNEPGRGKKMERLRECTRECRRLCVGLRGGASESEREAEEEFSGAELEVGKE